MKYLIILSLLVSIVCMVVVHDLHCEVYELKQNLARIGSSVSGGIIPTGSNFVKDQYNRIPPLKPTG